MTTTLTTVAATIDANGITAPTYADVYAYFQAKYQAIYGTDVYIDPDSQDGQLLAVFAQAIADCNSVTIGVYNSFSPSKAVGAALSSNVKINGIQREAASYSSADITLGGQAATTITNGIVKDGNNYQWALPATVTIPPAGEITVTATCTTIGAIAALAGTINQIGTQTRGWQTATNASDAAPGAPVELDPALRVRQGVSTALPSQTVLDGIVGAIGNVPGVTRYVAYENDTSVTDANGIPSHSIALVVEGGDATAIANAVTVKKTPGGGTYGTTQIITTNRYGMPVPINFFRPTDAPIAVAVAIRALPGYTTATGIAMQNAIAAYINGVVIGGGAAQSVEWDECVTQAKSISGASTFKIVSLVLTGPRGAGSPDVALLFNESASCTADQVTITTG
ncbi:baseplate J/gp47 family protein [Burkholderia arboris]|uniref:baseplate J/gp47 family protein n=1 Tax=Burkholderia arboris TaxID=488730 RepID=UPI00210CE486|nr:baseplate J/gp47 family protein [Burkholderia arboris]UTV56435.1 baseplate J/gp47 family protein [Burkholderia arboris]UTV56496.1 baseplate J/gp47 family protein [Burkholderia arboris]